MPKRTLIDIVQEILNDMDSDEVNSINDTIESYQVATIVKATYDAMMVTREWPHLRRLIQIQPSGDSSRPTHMSIQDSISRMVYLNYNVSKVGETRKKYQPMKFISTDEFLRMSNGRNNDETNIDVIVDPTGVELLIRNDQAPRYYTSFDDESLVFDSYDNLVDSTLQSSKVQALAYVLPTFTLDDSHIADLTEEAFPALVEEAKAKAFFKLKQAQDLKAEQESSRQSRWLSRKAWRVNGGVKYPDYGRRARKRSSPYFDKDNVKPSGS